jgi:hypothetical protein
VITSTTKALLGLGGLLGVVGILVLRSADPAPGGYVALFVGLPLVVIGVVLFGFALVMAYRPPRR